MAQYLDTDGDSTTGRTFVIQAPVIKVINDAGDQVEILSGTTQVANIPDTAVPFVSLTTAAQAYNALLAAMKSAGVMVDD